MGTSTKSADPLARGKPSADAFLRSVVMRPHDDPIPLPAGPCTVTLYGPDLAWIHHTGFGGFSEQAAPGLLELLRSRGVRQGRIVDAGCGGGQWLKAATDAGYLAIGIEPSPGLAALARETAPTCQVIEASVDEVELPSCDVITALGEVLCYHDPDGRAPAIEAFFAGAHEALAPGGLLVFDVIVEDESPSLAAKTWRAGEDWAVLVEIVEEHEQHRLTREIITFRRVDGVYRRAEERHVQQMYAPDDLEVSLRSKGFTVERLDHYGDLPMLPRRMAWVAEKRHQ